MKARLSLRSRLFLLHLLLLVVLLSLFGYVIFIDTRNYLIENTAVRLRAQAKPVIDQWLHADKRDIRTLMQNLVSKDTLVVITDADGNLLETDGNSVPAGMVYYRRSLAGDNEVYYITEVEGEPFLSVLIPLRKVSDPSVITGLVRLSTSLVPLGKILSRQKLMLVSGIILILFAGALLGFWITTVSLRELRAMVQTCNEIAGGDLGRRINLPGANDEIGQLAKAFDNMINRIEELFKTQTRFVANAAHELRTPMAALQGSLEVLMRGAQDDRDAFLRLTRGMYREVTRISRMSEQLLDLTKINTPRSVHKTRVQVKDIIADFIPYARIIAEERSLESNGSSKLYISVDSDSFKQILFNLTDNAIQHTETGGTIKFSWESAGTDIHIHIADDGCGITSDVLPHVFEPFFRGDSSRSRTSGGTGLGLAIVKSLVKMNGGYISVESIPGEGTVFTLIFPAALREAATKS